MGSLLQGFYGLSIEQTHGLIALVFVFGVNNYELRSEDHIRNIVNQQLIEKLYKNVCK